MWDGRLWRAASPISRQWAAHPGSACSRWLWRTDRVMADIVVVGAAPNGKALRRDGARTGDAIYVSGALGASALGLATKRGRAWKLHRRPQPRLALGQFLRGKL